MSTAFLVTSLVICLVPGTGALYTIAAGLTRGTRGGLLAAFAFFAFLPQFVQSGQAAPPQMALLSLAFMAMTFLTFAVYGLAAAAIRDRVLARPALVGRIRKAFAASFAVLGGRLAAESR